MKHESPLLTSTEVADLLGVKVNTVTAWRSRHRMPEPDVTYGRTPLWREDTILAWQGRRTPRTQLDVAG